VGTGTKSTSEVKVALQGTIETFALPDVLRLLASTKKSGELRLTGDRGAGSVWVASGEIVKSEAAGAPHAQGPVDVLFEMLRFSQGEFVFDEGDPADGGTPTEVEGTLADAEKLLEEWREIESVVPSGSAWVALASKLPADEVSIDKETWKAIVTVGGGATVDQLGAKLELGELPVARLVKDLTERSLVDIGDAPGGADVAPPASDPVPAAVAPAAQPDSAPAREPLAAASDRFDPKGLVIEEPSPSSAPPAAASAPAPLEEAIADASPGEAAEIARQLANLSPKAARAVAAAAKATTEEERNAALAEVEEGDDQINRELLLKFLGTVN
jgi:hypothetical protein